MSHTTPDLTSLHPHIDLKGTLTPCILTLDKETCLFKIEVLKPAENPTPKPSRPLSFGQKQKSIGSTPETIKFSCIHDILEIEFNIKTLSVQAYKYLKSWNAGKKIPYVFKQFEIHYGREFNLKKYTFITIKDPSDELTLKSWIDNTKVYMKGSLECSYFHTLDMWYSHHFETLKSQTTDTFRLKAWRQFLYNAHVLISLPDILSLLPEHYLNYIAEASSPIEKQEYDNMCRFLVHSQQAIECIFDKTLTTNVENSTLSDLQSSYPILTDLLKNYFHYFNKHGQTVPDIGNLNNVSSDNTKNFISKVIESIKYQNEYQYLIEDKWFYTNYILDYMYSPENTIYTEDTFQVSHDMTRPLSHYWINSSHNTYLTGNQYASSSSTSCYKRVLLQGCRCIEIDVWDGPKNRPIVTHGRTLTTSIPLFDVLNTIKKYAFVKTSYPLIISMENHCNVAQQKTMSKYFRRVFGQSLITSEEITSPIENLPSPTDLMNKIIIKGRRLPVEEQSECEFTEPQESCDCLNTGELWKLENNVWVECIFVLTQKKLFYMEKSKESEDSEQARRYTSVAHVDTNRDLHIDQVWFHGKIPGGRTTSEKLLKETNINGCYLVRNSDTQSDGYTLSYLCNGKACHCRIYTIYNNATDRMFSLKESPPKEEIFMSLYQLIEYYKYNPIITTESHLSSLTSPVPITRSHESCEWFYKQMDRTGAEQVLEKLPINGAFLARYSTNDRAQIVISFRYEIVIKHCQIKTDGRYLTVSNLKFPTLEKLVTHYSRAPFYKNIKLDQPVGEELYSQSKQSDCVRNVYCDPRYINATVKTVKGKARAIQSYPTDNPDLLSFSKGDLIINVVKEPGIWWWGTLATPGASPQPKLFCSTFVEEIEYLDCPFGNVSSGTYDLGIGASVKCSIDKTGRAQGFKYYLKFKHHDGAKTKLGAICSKRRVTEWMQHINYVVSNDSASQMKLAKIRASQRYNIAPEYSDLLSYCINLDHLNPEEIGFERQNVNVTGVKSFGEVMGKRVFADHPAYFVWYHQYAMTRTYPQGIHSFIHSSNFNPISSWNYGCQMVALNFQTNDQPMQLNRGKFRQNGNCGYVQKPGFMISEMDDRRKVQFDPTRLTREHWENKTTFHIHVISARLLEHDTFGPASPFVEIEIFGVHADYNKFVTHTITDNGLNPCWDYKKTVEVLCPELCLIQFCVYNADTFDKVLLGENTVAVPCIREGYRSVQLLNAYGESVDNTLLVSITRVPDLNSCDL